MPTILVDNGDGTFSSLKNAGSLENPALPSADAFTPSTYEPALTMDGTAQSGALASGVSKLQVVNLGATTEAIRIAFGADAAEAEANLGIAAGAATTGYYIPANAEGQATVIVNVPVNATHYAVANAVAADVQDVIINQGV